MKKIALFLLPLVSASCDHDIPMVNLGIDDTYYIYRMQKLDLHPALTGKEYRWYEVDEAGNEKLLSSERDYIFIAREEGVYDLRFEIIDEYTPYEFDFTINVVHEEVEYSPYISRVYEYCPAPGQFINEMPRYEDGDTYESILQKAEESISGTMGHRTKRSMDLLVNVGESLLMSTSYDDVGWMDKIKRSGRWFTWAYVWFTF